MTTVPDEQPTLFETPEPPAKPSKAVARKAAPPAKASKPAEAPKAGGLTAAEKRTLKAHETRIRKNIGAFIEVGESLAVIRDGRLYRETHGADFSGYCADTFGLTDRMIRYQIEGAETVAKFGTIVPDVPIINEGQARAVATIAKNIRGNEERHPEVGQARQDAVKAVLHEVAASGQKVTASAIEQAAKRLGKWPQSKSGGGKGGGKSKASTIKTAIGDVSALTATDATPLEIRELLREIKAASDHLQRLLGEEAAA